MTNFPQKDSLNGQRIGYVRVSGFDQNPDSPMANLMLSVIGAFAEFERALIRERQREALPWPNRVVHTEGARNPCPSRKLQYCVDASKQATRKLKWRAISESVGKRCTDTCKQKNHSTVRVSDIEWAAHLSADTAS